MYGCQLYFMDTTFNTTKTDLKTGPIVISDCFGMTARAGIFQMPDECSDGVDTALHDLSADDPFAVAATDGGPAWESPIGDRGQRQVEDTWHSVRKSCPKLELNLVENSTLGQNR